MKISSSTSTTSTSGMMLISASVVPPPRRSFPESKLNAIFATELRHGPSDEVEQIHREAFPLGGPVPDAVDEVVVGDDGGDGGREAHGGRDQRLGDTWRDDGEARGALLTDA